jgi:HSP20 family molecular chaperone IbpA
MTSAKLFRAIHFPKRIDPASAKAELKNGMLKFTARVVEEASARKLGIAAA